jgi:hypothetical protein
MKKIQNIKFIEIENLINSHLNNRLKEKENDENGKESIKTEEFEENLDSEYLKFLNLKGMILLENGYFTQSNKYFNLCSSHFNRVCKNSFHPLFLNNKLDEIYSQMYSSSNFMKLKENLLKTIAKSILIENDYLVFKGYVYLSQININSGNHRASKAIIDFAYSKLNSSNKNLIMDNHIFYKSINLYILTLKNFKNDKILKNFENHILAQNSKEFKEGKANNNIKVQYSELEYLANKAYYESQYSIDVNKINTSLKKINETIELLEKNDYEENLLAFLYLKKWAFENIIGREAISNFFIDESQRIIKNCYMADSIKNIEFLRALIINSININPPKIDIAFEILRKTKKLTEEVNCNSVLHKFFNIVINVRNNQSNVSEIFNLYEDFLANNSKYFSKDSEVSFDLKEILKSSKLGFVYKNKAEK